MSEFHYFLPTADAHTHVWFEVRAYSSGDVEVLTRIENGWLKIAAPGRRTYDVTVTIGGTLRYTGLGIVQYHHTRWARVDWAGTDPAAYMAQSVASMSAAQVVPTPAVASLTAAAITNYPDAGTKFSAWTADLAMRPVPFAIANNDTALGSGGFTDNVGVFNSIEMTFVASQHAGAYFAQLGNAMSAGRFCVHYRDELTGLPVESSANVAYTINDADSGISDAPGSSNPANETPTPLGGVSSPVWVFSHGQKHGYLAYLLSGRWHHLDTLQQYASTGALAFKTSWLGYNVAPLWTQLRTVAHLTDYIAKSAKVMPSHINGTAISGTLATYRTEALGRWNSTVDYNWTLLHPSATYSGDFGYMASARDNAFGVWYMNSFSGDAGSAGLADYSQMQQAFMQGAILWSLVSRTPTADQSKLDWLAQFAARHPVGLMGGTTASPKAEWRTWANYATEFATGSPGDTHTFYATWAAWESAFLTAPPFRAGAGDTSPPLPVNNRLYEFQLIAEQRVLRVGGLAEINAESSHANAMAQVMAYAYEAAGRVSMPGSETMAQRYFGSDTYTASVIASGLSSSWRNRPGPAVKPRRLLPSWVPTVVGTAALAPMTNTLESVWTDGVWAAGVGTQQLSDFSGGAYNPHVGTYGEIDVHGGGHSANNDNGIYAAGLDALTWTKPFAPTALVTSPAAGSNLYDEYITNGAPPDSFADTATANPREVAPGVPGSAHTYDSMFILPPALGGGNKGSLIRLMSGAVGRSASRTTGWAHRFDRATNTWTRWSTNACAWSEPGTAAVLDTLRNRAIPVSPPGFTIGHVSYLDIATRTWSNTVAVVPNASGYVDNGLAEYHPAKDIIVQAACANVTGTESANFYWFAGASNISTRALVSWTNGAGPRHHNWGRGSLSYVAATGQFFFWSRWNEDQYYLIDVPANPANPWTWTAYTISGATPSAMSPVPAGPTYGRMAYAPALRSVVWATGNSSASYHFGGRVWALRIVA